MNLKFMKILFTFFLLNNSVKNSISEYKNRSLAEGDQAQVVAPTEPAPV